MPASRKSRAPIQHIDILPPERRREEIVALFATGLERLILRGRPAGEELSESGHTCLDGSPEASLSVPTG
jgi:hypothetical protein